MRIVFLLSALLLLPCSSLAAETAATFQAAYDAADAARKKAASVGHEWRDTRKMLKKAKSLAEKGDFDKAVSLANAAKFQGEQAVEQAELQAKIWQDAVPK